MPPEIMLLPNWFPITIYDFSSWARATIVPLLIVIDRKPVKSIPESAQIDELYPLARSETDYSISRPNKLIGWETFFYTGDQVLRHIERLPWKPTRAQAIKKAEQWILNHQETDGSWGGIQPPWVYSLMALHELGYEPDHPVMKKGIEGSRSFSLAQDPKCQAPAPSFFSSSTLTDRHTSIPFFFTSLFYTTTNTRNHPTYRLPASA